MDGFARYGIYMVPEGDLYTAGAAWLGWDSVAGCEMSHPELDGLPKSPADLTATPRKYGFHGTIKPPFRMAPGRDVAGLDRAMRDFCTHRAPVTIARMEVRRLGGFVAIVPSAPSPAMADLASATVQALDTFRAPPAEAELAKRRKAGLSARQEDYLLQWGYPYVMDEFRFHLTLTGKLSLDEAQSAETVLAHHFAPHLDGPVTISSLCLMGEDENGRFHLVHRYPFGG